MESTPRPAPAPPARGLFVTGTDTGVGKTAVSAALLARARRDGLRVVGHKPVETGCAPGPDGAPLPSDARALWAAAGAEGDPGSACTLAFRAPLAPAVAAGLEGVEIDPDHLVLRARAAGAGADLLVVEGAGGLLVPLWGDGSFADWAGRLGLPVLVVAANRLGVLNHSLLTVAAARAAGLALVGVVLVEASPPDAADSARATNAEVLADLLARDPRGPVAFLGTLPWLPGASAEERGEALPRALVEAVLGG